ncbi:MAG: hypothetical protein WKF78_14905 [Candidatus Limnocylindrales bacterium]
MAVEFQNERDKANFLAAHPNSPKRVFRLEDHPILRGTLSTFELRADNFQQRAQAFETAFSDPAQWLNLTGALLSTGDYQRRRPNTPRWQFGTASPGNQAVWRYLLTAATHEDLAGTRPRRVPRRSRAAHRPGYPPDRRHDVMKQIADGGRSLTGVTTS